MKAIIITSITYQTIPIDPSAQHITILKGENLALLSQKGVISHAETVQMGTFSDSNGQQVRIGMTREVEQILGILMETFRNQNNEIEKLKTDLATFKKMYDQEYKAKINFADLFQDAVDKRIKLESASFWTRLRWLFTGVK